MNVMPLANLLEGAGLAKKGETLFVNMLPAEARQAVLLRSPLNGTPIDYELPGYFHAQFTVVVRTPAADYEAGLELIDSVTQALTLSEAQVENQFYNYCRPKTLPVTFPLSKGNLLETSIQFEANYVESP
jgi:hypothetical protein